MNLLIFSDNVHKAAECVNAASTFAGPNVMIALAVGSNSKDTANLLAESGAECVYTVSDARLDEYNVEALALLLERMVREMHIQGVLLGGTRRGREIGARLATRLRIGCASDCTAVTITNGVVIAERMVYGGKGKAVVSFISSPFVITLAAGAFRNPEYTGLPKAIVEEYKIDLAFDPRIVRVQTVKSDGAVDLTSANVIVSAGRGFRNKEDLKMANELAVRLDGALGCSRPISADFSWLSEEHQVGLSGRVVKPQLYVALGISGQIQHLAGIRGSRTIIAVNNDPTAPIADASDYFVEADLYEFVPALISKLEKLSR